jgi:ABC-type uncharacterized transport system substrate-binding protein
MDENLYLTSTQHLITRIFSIMLVLMIAINANGTSAPERKDILFVRSANSPVYQNVVDSTLDYLQQDGISVPSHSILLKDLDKMKSQINADTIVVSIGSKAIKALLEENITNPVINILTPSTTYYKLLECCKASSKNQEYAIFLNQPMSRHAKLLSNLGNNIHRIGIILSQDNEYQKDSIIKMFEHEGLEAQILLLKNSHNIGYELNRLFTQVDAVFVIPGNSIFNKHTLYKLLLSSYRKNIPVIGFSRSLVNSGALIALYSSPQNQAKQLAEFISSFKAKTGKSEIKVFFPKYFDIAINDNVANALGLDIAEKQTLIKQIK